MFRARFDDAPQIALEELLDGVERTFRPDDEASMEACGPLLAGYARDSGILPSLVTAAVTNLKQETSVSPIRTPQSFLIAVRETFYVRCNLWMPLSSSLRSREYQERLYSLEVPHDHNFSFLTVGHIGPGYQTDLFEYDRARVAGQVGEEVALHPAGSYTLGAGDVMLYRQGIDVHVQHQPSAPSASINIMFLSERNRREWQYLFDLETGRITGLSGTSMRSRQELIRLAGELGDEETAGLLDELAKRCPCAITREASAVALSSIACRPRAAAA